MFSYNINWFSPQKGWSYYPQVFLKECKQIEKENKVIRYITDDLKVSSCNFDESEEE